MKSDFAGALNAHRSAVQPGFAPKAFCSSLHRTEHAVSGQTSAVARSARCSAATDYVIGDFADDVEIFRCRADIGGGDVASGEPVNEPSEGPGVLS